MFTRRSGEAPYRVDILVLNRFSLLSFASTLEPLRAANRVSRRFLYRWRLLSADGTAPLSSSDVPLAVECALCDDDARDLLLVVAAFQPDQAGRTVLPLLRRIARRPTLIGGIEMGGWVMARAGLLNGFRATIHWEDLEEFAATFPSVEVVRDRHVIDRNRITTGGASPALDLMLTMIRAQHGNELALDVGSIFIYDEAHDGREPQTIVSAGRLKRQDGRLAAAIQLMEEALERPLPIQTLSARIGMSSRGLQKLFLRHLDCPPGAYYLHLRLAQAHRKLSQSARPILEIASEAGFRSPTAFSRAFLRRYGVRPSRAR